MDIYMMGCWLLVMTMGAYQITASWVDGRRGLAWVMVVMQFFGVTGGFIIGMVLS